jgi:hypothetical protein
MYPVPLGDGDGSLHRQIELLAGQNYAGAVSLEWINNGQTPVDPLPALQQYGATMQRWLSELRGAVAATPR